MRTRIYALLTVSLLSTLAALVVFSELINRYRAAIEEASKPADTVVVMVAARDLYPGVLIEEDDLFGVEVEPQYLPEGVYLHPDYIVGQLPRERILANEYIRGERLADITEGRGLNAILPRGMRAISMNIDNGPALSGLLQPGNYVDVLVTHKNADGDSETRTTQQGVLVLAVDSRLKGESMDEAANRRGKHRPSVTLLATAEQQVAIAEDVATGRITLALRNDNDDRYFQSAGVSRLGHQPEAPEQTVPVTWRPAEPLPEINLKVCHGRHCRWQSFAQ